jgi:DNA-binding response OmpR family regulator
VEGGALAGHTILLVDDQPSAAAELISALEAAGATVDCAGCARAAVLVERPFLSAAVLDCSPLSGDRRAIIRRLQQRRVPFLIYSTEPPATVTSGLGVPYVAKPSPAESVVAALALMLGRDG